MNDVFILGAGFSKAVSKEMPLMNNGDLSREVLRCFEYNKKTIPPEVRSMLDRDFEKTLTYLVSDQSRASLYFDLTSAIRGVFLSKSKDPRVWGMNRPRNWLEELVAYWHNNRSIVISLNYDTLIECVASVGYSRKRPRIATGELYPIRFTRAAMAESILADALKVQSPMETFSLLKLHGSINWFYSGRSDFLGEELFYVPCVDGIDGVFDGTDNADLQVLSGKCPLIVPPVTDKSAFFQHEALRSMWRQASAALKRADRVICLGYSLPEGDAHMLQLLHDSAPEGRVQFEVVDLQNSVVHFANTIGKDLYEFRQKHETELCIPRFVLNSLISDKGDKLQVAMEIYERRK